MECAAITQPKQHCAEFSVDLGIICSESDPYLRPFSNAFGKSALLKLQRNDPV